MPESEFKQLQYELAAHIRDPSKHAPPTAMEDRRMAIYRDLFFNNLSSLLAGTYPVLHEIMGQEKWHSLVRDYFARHQSHTPYFLEIPGDFLAFLEHDRGQQPGDLPFMLELAHYEWIELALSVAEEEVVLDGIDREADLLQTPPVVSPLARLLSYRFPVHQIGPENLPMEPPADPTWLVVVRDLQDRVGFVHINQVTARLLELAAPEDLSGHEILEQIAAELGHQRPEVVIEGGRDLLKMLREKDIILGARQR